MTTSFDVAVIGGGINGCGVAADAQMRGLSVVLLEKDDIAAKTSSSSSKLIHGGLRYLEHHDFSLVKKALVERQRLLHLAPHLVKPQPFVLPYQQMMRPAWLLRTGLFVYDNLSRKNKLPHSKPIKRSDAFYFAPLREHLQKGFLFYDCTTDDARLTLCNALQAKKHGATILTRHEVVGAQPSGAGWQLTVRTKESSNYKIFAKCLINATGPWVTETNKLLRIQAPYEISLVKGSHIVVPQLYEGTHAYMLQNEDQRIVFVIPYHGNTMIGTTDIFFQGNPDKIEISSEEVNYLLSIIGHYFEKKVDKKEIINTWSGVRPLLYKSDTSAQELSRDYQLYFSNTPAPVLNIYGGKITTYRQLAIDVVDELQKVFPDIGSSTTANAFLPGAIFKDLSFVEYQEFAQHKYQWLDNTILARLLQTYGTLTENILGNCTSMLDLGKKLAPGLFSREVDYLIDEEWACQLEDILWRRTKLGYSLPRGFDQSIKDYMQQKQQAMA